MLASAIPIAPLGVALANQYQAQMDHRALDQAVSEADAIANAGIEPVLGTAQVARWERAGLSLGVAVNVSARNLRDEALVDRVVERLAIEGGSRRITRDRDHGNCDRGRSGPCPRCAATTV